MKMDNKWADMFWDNRNRQQEHPEEIDDEQLYCLYNLLILYHIQNDELLDTIIRIKDEETLLYEELTSFFGKNEKTEVKDVIKSVIERLQKAGNFPLTWFERLNLLSPGFFKFAYNKLNTLTSYCKNLMRCSFTLENPIRKNIQDLPTMYVRRLFRQNTPIIICFVGIPGRRNRAV